ncbi:MAG: lipopolysaccharide biosynthesis protein [Actinomycetes bacterium]
MTDHRAPAHLRRIGRGGSQNLAASGVAALLGMLLSIVVARAFTTTDNGLYLAATSVVLLIATVTRLGTAIGLVYWVSRLRELGRYHEIPHVLRLALQPVVALSVVTAVLMFVLAPRVSDLLLGCNQAECSHTGASMLRALAVALPAIVLLDSLLGASRGFGTMKPTAVLDRIARPSAQLLLTVIAILMGGLLAVTVAWALPYFALVVIAGWWLTKQVRFSAQQAEPLTEDPPVKHSVLRKEFWTFTWPRAITSVVQAARQRFDIVLVSAISGPTEAALYGIASRFLVVGQLTNSALALAAQPHVASMATADRKDSISAVYRSTTTWIILLNGPLYVGVAIFSPLILSLFGPQYVHAWPVTVTLCIAAFLGNGSGMVDVMLSMTGRTSATLANSLGALITQVVLLLALVPTWGAFGAAIAWGVSIVVINAMSVVQLARSDGIHPFESGTGYAVLSNFVCVGVPAGIFALWLGETWLAFGLSLVVCSACYVGFARIFRRQLHIPELVAALRRSQ